MKINIGKNDICYTCQFGKQTECDAGIDDVFLDDTGNICDCKCYEAREKKKNTSKQKVTIPDEILPEYQAFKEMRQKIKKPLTDIAAIRLINRLNELAPDNYELQKEMLLNSVDNCWKTVYLPKTSKSQDKLQSKPSYDLDEIKRRMMNNTEI